MIQSFYQIIENFKEDFDLLWSVIIFILGFIARWLWKYASLLYKQKKIKNRVEKSVDMEELNVLRICSAVPYYRIGDISIKVSPKKLYIGFPKDKMAEVIEKDKDFRIHEDCSFNGSSDFIDIIEKTEIPELKALIEKHREIVAAWFINRENGCKFNRPKYGVYHITHDFREGDSERPQVALDLFETDYFTHRVIRSIYAELKSRNHPISTLSQANLLEGLKKYNAFTTSLGLNAFVSAQSKHGESIIFSRRSDNAAHTENKFKYNSTVMEGISQTDYNEYEHKVSLEQAMDRALYEELGIPASNNGFNFDRTVTYHDFFIEMNYFEIGITANVHIDAVFEQSIKDLPAKDKELEINKLVAIPKRKTAIDEFINKEVFYPQALFTLKMICARDMIFIDINRK